MAVNREVFTRGTYKVTAGKIVLDADEIKIFSKEQDIIHQLKEKNNELEEEIRLMKENNKRLENIIGELRDEFIHMRNYFLMIEKNKKDGAYTNRS